MKLHLLLLTALCTATLCSAKENMANPRTQVAQAQNGRAAKTTAAQQRIIGYSYRQVSTTAVNDTVKYVYNTMSRGSGVIGWNVALYPDPMQTPQLIKCDSFTYKLTGLNNRGRLNYNSSNEAIEMRIDSFGPGGYQLKDQHYYEYDASHRRSADTQYYVPYGSSYKRFRTYDGSGHAVMDSSYNYTSMVPSYKQTYVNNAAGDPTLEMYYTWNSTTMDWEAAVRTTNTYDGSGRKTLTIREQNVGAVWTNSSKDTFAYTGAVTDYTYVALFSWVSGAWVGSSANSYHLDGTGKWDTAWYYNWNNTTSSFDITEKDFLLYNTAGNIIIGQGILYDITTGTYAAAPYDINKFYYEDYDDAGVRDNSPLMGVRVYPNPVSGMLHIDMSGLSASAGLQVRITDIQGRVMLSNELGGLAGASFDVSGYAPGTYIISVSSEGRAMTQVFVKR